MAAEAGEDLPSDSLGRRCHPRVGVAAYGLAGSPLLSFFAIERDRILSLLAKLFRRRRQSRWEDHSPQPASSHFPPILPQKSLDASGLATLQGSIQGRSRGPRHARLWRVPGWDQRPKLAVTDKEPWC